MRCSRATASRVYFAYSGKHLYSENMCIIASLCCWRRNNTLAVTQKRAPPQRCSRGCSNEATTPACDRKLHRLRRAGTHTARLRPRPPGQHTRAIGQSTHSYAVSFALCGDPPPGGARQRRDGSAQGGGVQSCSAAIKNPAGRGFRRSAAQLYASARTTASPISLVETFCVPSL